MVLQERVNNEDWFQMMDIFSFLSLSEDVYLWTNISLCDLRQLGLYVVSESAEFLDVDGFTSLDVIADVLDQGFPDDDVLSFWLQRFQVGSGSLGGHVVLSRVLVTVLKDPIDSQISQVSTFRKKIGHIGPWFFDRSWHLPVDDLLNVHHFCLLDCFEIS